MEHGDVVGRALAIVMIPLTAAVIVSGCGNAAGTGSEDPTASEQTATGSVGGSDVDGAEVVPGWTDRGVGDGTVSFADGPALEAATDVTFSNSLGEVWDWELVGAPESTTTAASPPVTLEMVNTGNDCRVLDERAPFEGAGTDDGAASTALVEERLAGAEVMAGPAQDLVGLGEPPGEGGSTYNVARAVGRAADGMWLLVTARAFIALGVQQVVTVSCPSGEGIDLTLSQLTMVSFANLRGLERYP